jgi:radical SAM superfamily enzyme YgiQ (UPF0313 family)
MESIAILYPREEKVGKECLAIYYINYVARCLKLRSKIYFLDSKDIAEVVNKDVVFISCHYENNYPYILNMLKNAGIEIDRNKRKQKIVLGGPVTCNPYPLYNFIDYFIIGDGEGAIADVMENMEKEEMLLSFPFVFAPEKKEIANANVAKHLAHEYVEEIDHDYLLLEVQRGCRSSCLFCLIGWTEKTNKIYNA